MKTCKGALVLDLNEARYKLNKDIPIPLYYQVKRMILNELSSGKLKQGDKLPGETEFCEHLGISRPTVRLALSELETEGILVRKKKSGTFVAEPKLELDLDISIEHLKRHLDVGARECEIELLDLCVVDGIEIINQRLNLEQNDQLIYLKRMWKVGGVPIVYNAAYLSKTKFEQLLNKDFTEINLFEHLKIHFDIKVRDIILKVESTLASKNDIELLEINKTRASLFCVTDFTLDENEEPISYSVTRYRGDKVYISYKSKN